MNVAGHMVASSLRNQHPALPSAFPIITYLQPSLCRNTAWQALQERETDGPAGQWWQDFPRHAASVFVLSNYDLTGGIAKRGVLTNVVWTESRGQWGTAP
jgi:hypothetical protein